MTRKLNPVYLKGRLCITKIFSTLAILLVLLVSPLLAQKKVVGYTFNYSSPTQINFSRLTHLNIAFENPDDAGNLSYGSGSGALITAARANNVKVLVSIGGGSASNNTVIQNRYFNLIKPANRAAFISKIVAYLSAHNYDGIDVDLEGPAINSDYSGFIIDLKKALPNKLVTAALSHTNNGGTASSTAVQTFDFLNVMAYDRGWGQAVHHSTYDFAVTSMEWWVTNKGAKPERLILGVPFYGYNNTTGSGYRSYANIINTFGTAAANQDTWTSSGNTVYYNGVPTIRKKSQLVVDKNYGGIMIWELTQDLPATNSLSLLNNIKQVLGTSCLQTPIKPYISVNNGSWQTVTSVTVSAGAKIVIGPQPLGGTWSWTGPNGFTSTSREITFSSIQSSHAGKYIGTYTNSCGAKSSLTFTISVNAPAFSLTLEAENYKYMAGIITESCSEGGLNIGSFDAGDWASYQVNIPVTGVYTVSYRVASIYSSKTLRLEKDAGTTKLGTVTVPNTGSWQKWTAVSDSVTLPAGSYTVALASSTGGFNVNKFTISTGSSTRLDVEGDESEISVQVHPNPVETTLGFTSWKSFEGGHVRIIDLAGKEYINRNIEIENIDVAMLPPGLYVLRLTNGKKSIDKRFLKK